MGGFATTRNIPGGIQTDVSGASAGFPGGPGGMDMGWLMDLAKRRAQQKLQAGDIENQGAAWALQQAQKARFGRHPGQPRVDMSGGPYRQTGAQQRLAANAALPEQTAAQRAVSATGGRTGQAYSDSMRQMMGNTAMGMPQTTYTGWTDLVEALNQGGAGATAAAAASEDRNKERNSPINQAAAQQALANRMYPGLAQRLYGQKPNGE